MTMNEFAQLLQNEMILPRDPHIVSRFVELVDEYFAIVALEPTPADGVNVVLQEPSVADPTPSVTDASSQTEAAPLIIPSDQGLQTGSESTESEAL